MDLKSEPAKWFVNARDQDGKSENERDWKKLQRQSFDVTCCLQIHVKSFFELQGEKKKDLQKKLGQFDRFVLKTI